MENPGNPGGGDDSMYSDSPDSHEMEQDQEKPEEGGETTLIPKSMGMGKDFKPGDEIVLQITAIHDDQYEVKYAEEKGKGEEQEQPAPAEAPAGPGGGEMSSLYG